MAPTTPLTDTPRRTAESAPKSSPLIRTGITSPETSTLLYQNARSSLVVIDVARPAIRSTYSPRKSVVPSGISSQGSYVGKPFSVACRHRQLLGSIHPESGRCRGPDCRSSRHDGGRVRRARTPWTSQGGSNPTTSAMVGRRSMVKARRSSMIPPGRPGALTNIGTGAMSPTVSGRIRRQCSIPGTNDIPWSATTISIEFS